MTARIILITFFATGFIGINAQTATHFVIAQAIDKKGYFFIPKSALADSVKAILYQANSFKNAPENKMAIKLYWNSKCNDGSYNLTITPEQIYFSSSHNNPNPNYLFWVIDIDSMQYQQIKNGCAKKPPEGFENTSKNYRQSIVVYFDKQYNDTVEIPEAWTKNTQQTFYNGCEIQLKTQLERCSKLLNTYLNGTTSKFFLPTSTSTQKMKPKYFSDNKQEILDWLPVKFKQPKLVPASP